MVDRRLIDAIVTVSEAEVEEALLRAWTRLKLALEPTAGLPLAAYLNGKLPLPEQPGAKFALVLSGGNFDPGVVARLLSR